MSRALVLAAALLAGCPQGQGPTRACVDAGDCEGVAICTALGECQAVECTQPAHCNLGYTCDVANTCVEGCATEEDCFAGEACSTAGECEPYGCRSSTLDCNYGERCDPTTHQCAQDVEPHCLADCTVDWFSDSCELITPNAVCACFGSVSGSTCVGNTYCLVECDPSADEPCPRGFQCAQAFSNSTTPYCIADCDFISQF